MSKSIEPEFEIGQEVFFRTDPEQLANMVTAIMIKKGAILYEVSFVTQSSWHYAFELSSERNILLATGIPVEKQ